METLMLIDRGDTTAWITLDLSSEDVASLKPYFDRAAEIATRWGLDTSDPCKDLAGKLNLESMMLRKMWREDKLAGGELWHGPIVARIVAVGVQRQRLGRGDDLDGGYLPERTHCSRCGKPLLHHTDDVPLPGQPNESLYCTRSQSFAALWQYNQGSGKRFIQAQVKGGGTR